MATETTIKSTDLDFHNIKDSLKQFFLEKEEFADYNFEASGLSNILDVLAYNTHYNALIANFALNESYLSTAQLRNSVVSLAESLGYIPDSRKSARATVSFSLDLSSNVTNENSQLITVDDTSTFFLLPGDLSMSGEIDGISYTFTNRETLIGESIGNKIFQFRTLDDDNTDIEVYEGLPIKKNFIVGQQSEAIYIIPDQNLELETAIVKVFNDSKYLTQEADPVFYTNLLEATELTELSTIYVLRESPNEFYELTFGNGSSLGRTPNPGNVIQVDYLRSSGSAANGITTLKLSSTISLRNSTNQFVVTTSRSNGILTVLSRAAGGGEKENIESIRLNAPYQYASQNRMVTALDYSSLILKNFSTYIDDIKSWGGEDDPNPDFGTVFTSIVFKENLPNRTVVDISRKIEEYADNLSIVSFRLKFVDPIVTYLSTRVFFQYNPTLGGAGKSTAVAKVNTAVANYFEENTGKFDQNFRRSNLLTLVDAADPAILSSRCNVVMHRRIVPVFTLTDSYKINYPVAIAQPNSSEDHVVYSSFFTVNNRTVRIQNKLNSRVIQSGTQSSAVVYTTSPSTTLELVDSNENVVVPNIGSYDPDNGIVYIENLNIQSIVGGIPYINIYATPSNQSVVTVSLNNIIKWDANESANNAIVVTTSN